VLDPEDVTFTTSPLEAMFMESMKDVVDVVSSPSLAAVKRICRPILLVFFVVLLFSNA
jgi:hypothetical protein